MSSAGTVSALPILKDEQARASAPDTHVWLSASAGTGKTQVLAARVFRLLLRGVEPAAILCLTFTKAGAAEMAARINARLAAWVRMPLGDLRKDLLALGEAPRDDATIERARTLFARVLDAPGGGIRIQTIHGFCQGLLAAFPMEAELVPGFRPLEPREEAQLAREALVTLLVDAEREGRTRPVATIGALSRRMGEGGAEQFLRDCARSPEALAALPSGVGAYVRRALDLPSGDIEAVLHDACTDAFDEHAIGRLIAANRGWGTASGVKDAEAGEAWLAADAAGRVAMLERLRLIAHTAKGDPRKYSAKLVTAEADYEALAVALGGQCAELLSLRVRAAYADLLADALTVGRDYAAAYARAKRRVGAVDFDDLIRATVALLGQENIGAWIRYKLDQATEHVLIDEAQDTNLRQWAIVKAIADDFFPGHAGRGARTLFTVGDYKQAIFGFQGTDPIYLRWAERQFRQAADVDSEIAGVEPTPFAQLSLTQSFRSTRPILQFVDAALAMLPDPGLGAVAAIEAHASEVVGRGEVTLWPPIIAGADAGTAEGDEEEWIDDATRALATKIARQVRDWLADPDFTKRNGERLEPQDVMILVKRRGDLASLLVARLYAEGVPVAGVDRLRLNAPLAVQDLLAAARFALQPEDDLALASLLVSPLIGWTQDELMTAAIREGGGLWRHIVRTQPEARVAPLGAILARVDIATPYQFFEEMLSGSLDGRRKLLRRLGAEARDPIEELLNAALAFETQTAPSLQQFLDWFDRGDVEIVRDPSAPLDAVRVMTAHGAKGLQAPLVILADACVDPTAAPRSTLRWPQEDGEALPIFRPRSAERGGPLDQVIADSDRRELEEHWRLFYVAATRAEERLVIAGALGPKAKGEPPAMSWYRVASAAITTLGVGDATGARTFAGGSATGLRAHKVAAEVLVEPLPDWARRPAPQEQRPPRPLAPSSLGEDAVADPPPSAAMRAAAERGRLIHALFERLPTVTPERRASAAERWLASAGGVDSAEVRAEIASAVLTVMNDPAFAELFGPDSLGEAPVAAVLDDGLVVSGTVDRLLVIDEAVRIVDFKTGRHAPASVDEVPSYHRRQLAAYAAALGVIFPGRRVKAALLYTAGPVLIDIPPELLARDKPGFAPAEQSLPLDG